jgi:hypothetical protein
MRRRFLLVPAALAALVAVASLATQRAPGLLILEWAHKAPAETPPVAVLLEFGQKDVRAVDWSGRATVAGARVVRREGYRFRPSAGDRLTDPDGWQASSHAGLRVPKKSPAVSKMEPIATVGVVLHLADVKDNATLTVELQAGAKDGRGKQTVALAEVLKGRAHALWGGAAVVRLVSTATTAVSGPTEDDYPAAAYGPDGTLWLAYVSYTVRDDSRRIEQRAFKKQPENFKSLYTPELADQVWLKSYRGGKWGEPIAITGPKESVARCAVAVEGNGDVWVAYSAFRKGHHGLFARRIPVKVGAPPDRKTVRQVGPEQSLGALAKAGPASYLSPVACTARDGSVYVACQSDDSRHLKAGYGTYLVRLKEDKAKFISSTYTSWFISATETFGGNRWAPAIAAPPGERQPLAVACDHSRGDSDVGVDLYREGGGTHQLVAASSRFEARPAVAYDPKGRLWIAYEEGPEGWGKDYGSLVPDRGSPLYSARSVRVVCLDTDGKLKRPAAELPTSTVEPPRMAGDAKRTHRYEGDSRYAYPQLGIDGKGRVWLTYRRNFGSRYTTHPGSYWLTFARRLDGDRWSDEIEVHHSDGLLDSRPALLPHNSGGIVVVHNTDGRHTTPEVINNDIYLSHLNLPGGPVEPKLVPHDPGKKNDKLVQKANDEAEAVKRMRAYRVEAGGKKLRLLRGEFHRHTEISWDGGADGSLEDMFRYALDAASLDWIANGDHDNGAGREYSWWLTQKWTDAYHVPGAFAPMFSYERSVAYPHGHRNCMFAQRGVRTLPRLAPPAGATKKEAPGGVHPDDTKMLYRYLRELGGLCASHTSATSMGTDWRDNDPAAEPVVEIYQGDRMSYEHEGAPRAGYEAKSGKEPVNVAGWYPKGFINLALGKGYKLGFQASSDHWSTHISFFVVLAERNDRAAILEAIKKRHCYGATDNIVLDVRSGEHLMGDELKTNAAPALQINVEGTGDLAKVEVLRDSKVVHTVRPKGRAYRGAWTDPSPEAGAHYYYVRVLQADGEIAWASPLWIDYRK